MIILKILKTYEKKIIPNFFNDLKKKFYYLLYVNT